MTFINYTIYPKYRTVSIDSQSYGDVDMAGIPANVNSVVWNGVKETGEVQYEPDSVTGHWVDPTTFTDPNDYYTQTQSCLEPLVCYATSSESVYKGKTYGIGSQLNIYQWPNPEAPVGFTCVVPPVQSLSYTSLFWNDSEFVWSLFDPSDPLAEGKTVSTDWVNATAYSILQPTDWYVVRQSETGTVIPPQWNSWRETIREEAREKNASIAGCNSVDELLSYTLNPNFNTWAPAPK
jgi:hypothetical protein